MIMTQDEKEISSEEKHLRWLERWVPEMKKGEWYMISEAWPMQYEQITKNNNYAYIRYRWGNLDLHVAKSLREFAKNNDLYHKSWKIEGERGEMYEDETDECLTCISSIIEEKGL